MSKESTKSPQQPTQRETAYEAIRDALIVQALPAGQKLSEPAWVERLSVSRTAVREAFARLEAEGLIEHAPTAGYIVPALSAEDVAEIVELRLALESAAIERICARRLNTDEYLAPLREACDQQAEFLAHGYLLGATEADRRFHQRLIDLAGNRRLIRMYRRAPLPLLHRALASRGSDRSSNAVVEAHRAILDAVRHGDADAAQRLLRQHLLTGLDGAAL